MINTQFISKRLKLESMKNIKYITLSFIIVIIFIIYKINEQNIIKDDENSVINEPIVSIDYINFMESLRIAESSDSKHFSLIVSDLTIQFDLTKELEENIIIAFDSISNNFGFFYLDSNNVYPCSGRMYYLSKDKSITSMGQNLTHDFYKGLYLNQRDQEDNGFNLFDASFGKYEGKLTVIPSCPYIDNFSVEFVKETE